MPRVLTATDARVHFGELMRQVVATQEPVIVERDGTPQVVVLSLAEYQRLTAGQPQPPDWWELATRSRQQIASRLQSTGCQMPPIDAVFAQMRDERDEQLSSGLR